MVTGGAGGLRELTGVLCEEACEAVAAAGVHVAVEDVQLQLGVCRRTLKILDRERLGQPLGAPRATTGRNSPGEEDTAGESKRIQRGSHPAGFVVAEAPAHASTD